MIRLCEPNETTAILSIINAGAEAYRGVIPDDYFHDHSSHISRTPLALASRRA